MSSSSLAAYLTKNYLTADKPKEKKRRKKRTHDEHQRSNIVESDEFVGFEKQRQSDEEEEDQDGPDGYTGKYISYYI